MLLTRPGRNPLDDADRSWARCLTSAAEQLSVSMWPVHFANDVELRVFAPPMILYFDRAEDTAGHAAQINGARVCHSQASPKIGRTRGTKP